MTPLPCSYKTLQCILLIGLEEDGVRMVADGRVHLIYV